MEIKFYGSSHGLSEVGRFCTSVLLEAGGKYYIIDAGAPISDLLIRDGIPHKAIEAIFITHLHFDHIDGLPGFLSLASWYHRDTDPVILTPSLYLKEAVDAWILLELRRPSRDFKFREIAEGEIFDDGNIAVAAVRTEHHLDNEPGHLRYSYGFIVTEKATGKRIIFTGDICDDLCDFPSVAFNEHCDMIVMDGAHPDLDNCSEILAKCKTDHLVIGHVNPHLNTPEKIERLASRINIPVTEATDGMVINF